MLLTRIEPRIRKGWRGRGRGREGDWWGCEGGHRVFERQILPL